jgi:four helix bundle protein
MGQFRDLKVWQRSMDFVEEVYRVTRGFPKDEMYQLTGQLRRAATSIPLNVAEGAGQGSPRAFARSLRLALGSCYEVATGLELARRLGYLEQTSAQQLDSECSEIGAMITGLIKSQN